MIQEISAPLIVVSNRLPFVLHRDSDGRLKRKANAGGLVTAVAPVVIECNGLWVGWSGLIGLDPKEAIPESDPQDKTPTAGLKSKQVVAVHIDEKAFDAYYNGCCNGTFWPLFHSMPDRAVFKSETWEVIMEENLRAKLTFFLHIPFPSWDIMHLFPWDDVILQGMLACDMVGFHIEDYCLNFIDCCSRRLGCRVDRNKMLVEIAGRTVHVKALPIGIPFDRFVELAEATPKHLKNSDSEKIILGVDRLDYTKGLVHRIRAFERLLEKHPEYEEKVTLLQIAVPSKTDVREYQQLKEEIDQLIGRINGRFSRPNWFPIRYIYGGVNQDQLAALYRDSDVALVTPLRDGMNLVAKEFVACQINEPGVLILSPFAGAGGMMHEALSVNPYEINEAANTIHRALQMPSDKRELRMKQLRQREKLVDAYSEVNKLFANSTLQALRTVLKQLDAEKKFDTYPVVWIHDYQLLVAATTIRQVIMEENLRAKLTFFLHIPFPSWDIMRLFPWDDVILQGMLACDMVGFHIEDYCLNFIDCCSRRLGCRVDRNKMLVEIAGRTVHVKALPIGIPFDRFVELAEATPKHLKNSDSEKIILGVDRLDYTKGLVHRIRAFERLLEKHPEYEEKVTLLQIAVPSRTDVREYQQLKEEIDQLIGRINGRFSRPNWSPIRYIYGGVNQDQLAALYRDSDVALVTPLRDGMNLVAKEFVACQINEPGVLILSPFAGAGGMMHEALLVNPYEINEAANTIHRALQMPSDERELRMKQLRQREKLVDVNSWMNSFLASMGALNSNNDHDPLSTKMSLTLDDFDEYLNNHIDEHCKLSVILDYDGTLTHLASHPDLAIMPEETKRVLVRLSNMRDVSVAIISGRSVENVKKMVGIDKVTYAGSHGIEILHPDGTKFVHPVPYEYSEKLKVLVKLLKENVVHDGAWVEHKGVAVTFHYREVSPNRRNEIVKRASRLFRDAGFEPHQSFMALEVKPPVKWDQGRACLHILRTTFGADWLERVRVVYAGNEGAMKALQGIAVTFRVDSSPTVRTAANFRLAGPDAVLTMLRWIEKQMNKRAPRINSRSPLLSNRSPMLTTRKSECWQSQISFNASDEEEEEEKTTSSLKILDSLQTNTISQTKRNVTITVTQA